MKEPVCEEFEGIYCDKKCKNLHSSLPLSPNLNFLPKLIKQLLSFHVTLSPEILDLILVIASSKFKKKKHQCLLHVSRPNGKTFILVAAPSLSEGLYVITITLLQTQQGDETCEEHGYMQKKKFEAISVTR